MATAGTATACFANVQVEYYFTDQGQHRCISAIKEAELKKGISYAIARIIIEPSEAHQFLIREALPQTESRPPMLVWLKFVSLDPIPGNAPKT